MTNGPRNESEKDWIASGLNAEEIEGQMTVDEAIASSKTEGTGLPRETADRRLTAAQVVARRLRGK